MLTDWKNWFCYCDHTSQDNLHIHCNLYQTPTEFFIELETNNSKTCMETQKAPQ